MTEFNKVTSWYGRLITELNRDELLEVIEYCGKEIISLKEDRNKWREAGNSFLYLKNISKN